MVGLRRCCYKKMIQTKPSSVVESVSGNIITESALTAIAGISGGPLAALLPVLATSLASGRQKERVEKALVDIHLNFGKTCS